MYYVLCNDDDTRDGEPGARIFATRRPFATRPDAERYAATVNAGRYPAAYAYDSAPVLSLQLAAALHALEWATVYVELFTGDGARSNPSDWPRLANGDPDPEAIAKHCHAVLARAS